MNRREFVKRLVVSSFLVATAVTAGYEMLSRLSAVQQQAATAIQQPSTTQTTGQGSSVATSQIQAPAGYVFVTPVSSLAGKTSAYFSHPTYGNSILVNAGGQWKAFSATCTHQSCTVGYAGGSSIQCPCHGATFSTSNGSVLTGPAPRPLPEYGLQIDSNGDLFVTTSVIN